MCSSSLVCILFNMVLIGVCLIAGVCLIVFPGIW